MSLRTLGLTIRCSLTFSVDIDLLIYKSHDLFWRDVISSGDILNSLIEELTQLLVS